MRKYFRFSLRTVLVLILALSVYLAWRLHNPEWQAIAAISEFGGKTYSGYQQPSMHAYPSQVVIALTGSKTTPNLTFLEVLFGESESRKIRAVELELVHCTPEMINHLKCLSQLDILMIETPHFIIPLESEEAKKLNEIVEQFGNRVRTKLRGM